MASDRLFQVQQYPPQHQQAAAVIDRAFVDAWRVYHLRPVSGLLIVLLINLVVRPYPDTHASQYIVSRLYVSTQGRHEHAGRCLKFKFRYDIPVHHS